MDAITHGHAFEIASFDAGTLVYRKERLLAPLPGSGAHRAPTGDAIFPAAAREASR